MAHLLIVEDDPVSLRILVSLLQKRGHEPHTASSVGDAITVLERNTLIDLVILDNQLQGEYGWQFLEYVRKDFIFRNLPILIYTGSSDRNSVLKFLQLGVQKILVKPYNASHIEEEIKRAVQFDWRGMVFEPPTRVCQRLNIGEDDYYKSLMRGAMDVKDHVPAMNKLVGSKDLRVFDEHLSALQSLALNLGASILENAVESIQESLRTGKLDQSIYFINRLVPTARLMHHRALSHFGLTNNEEFPQDLFGDQRDEAAKKSRDLPRAPVPAPLAIADPIDAIVQSPLSSFIDDFRVLLDKGLFAPGEVESVLEGSNAAVGVEDIVDSLRFLARVNNVTEEVMVAFIRQMPGLDMRIIEIANNLSPRSERVVLLEQAIGVLGVNMVSCIVIPIVWLRASRRGRNPLRLEAMARHSMAVSLLVRELAIKFSGTQEFAAAALAHNVGKWLLALQYPAFFGMSLLLGREKPDEVLARERRIFGIDHRELGAKAIAKAGMSPQVIACTLFMNDPGKVVEGESQIVTSMVNLSDLLARIKGFGCSGSSKDVTPSDFVNSPAWAALKHSQVKIPLDPPEYLSALDPVVERVRGIVDMALD
ncbi:MAG: response regulator [Opitutales bacterium]|jgi:CheY-like chemotaxis protein